MKNGFIFSFEGGDFAGKGTLIKSVTQMLNNAGYAVSTLSYYEPGGTPYADMIRSFLKKTFDTPFAQKSLLNLQETVYSTDISPVGQALGFFTAREHQFYTKIKPEYYAGKIILLDRSIDSTTVYQGHAQDTKLIPWIRQTNEFIVSQAEVRIKKTFFLDISLEERKTRMTSRGEVSTDRFEKKGDSFAQKIREGYLTEAEYCNSLDTSNPDFGRIVVIDANGTREKTAKHVFQLVCTFMKE